MSEAYRRAGVDLDAAARAVALIRSVAESATRPEVVAGVGGFAGLFRLDDERFLAAAADGVGSKLEVARLARRYDTVGIDLVAMSVNDLACTGAEPLFFLDYLAVERLEADRAAQIVSGVAEGCRRAGCALLGGETAEHPGTMGEDRFDLAGFAVGIVHRDDRIGPTRVSDGDALIGIASSGLHSNGFSLVRSSLIEGSTGPDAILPDVGRPLVDELLEPTAVYARLVRALVSSDLVGAAAHITGGGLTGNVPRALPEGLGAAIELGSWEPPPIFGVVQRAAAASDEDMWSTFNMGVGMVLVTAPLSAEPAIARCREAGFAAWRLGSVEPGAGVRFARGR